MNEPSTADEDTLDDGEIQTGTAICEIRIKLGLSINEVHGQS